MDSSASDPGSPKQHVSSHSHMRPAIPQGPTMDINQGIGNTRTNVSAESNVPNRFELFLLGDGEKKVTEEIDTRIPNASVFTFNKEDHTLGNLIRSRLLQNTHVQFSGYKVPHPLVSKFELRVQTDGSVSPREAVIQTCKDLVNDLGIFSREFTKEWELRKMVGDGGNEDGTGK